MRKTTLFFILAELLDLATTRIGLAIPGVREMNIFDFNRVVVLKVIITVCIACILQIKRPARIDVALPIAAGLVVPWNIINIITAIS